MEGQAIDPKTWKANFRCAMNSLPDITEVKTMSVNKGHQAVRVFKMLPVVSKCKGETGSEQTLHRRRAVLRAHNEPFMIFTESSFLLRTDKRRKAKEARRRKVDRLTSLF